MPEAGRAEYPVAAGGAQALLVEVQPHQLPSWEAFAVAGHQQARLVASAALEYCRGLGGRRRPP